jgi:predicted NBD/HSP70 family sugar kinase
VGRGGAELGLCDFLGDLRYYRRETYVIPAPDDIIAFTTDAVEAFVDQLPMAHRGRVAGLGIALPFRMWDWAKDATKENAAKLNGWRNRDLAAELAQVLDLPVFLCNDASAACGAELVFGTQDKPRDFLYAYVGHFVGGGLVLGNALFTGGTGNAAALASIPVTARSGEMRQLVDLASLATLDRMLAKAGEDRAAIQDRSKEWTLAPTVLEAWLDGAAYGLAQAIASSACVIDFETVVIDGSMPVSLRAELVRRTQAELQGLKVPGIALPDACEGTIGYDAKVRGAASLPLSGRFLVDRTLVSGG